MTRAAHKKTWAVFFFRFRRSACLNFSKRILMEGASMNKKLGITIIAVIVICLIGLNALY
jgi:hypothetical protein